MAGQGAPLVSRASKPQHEEPMTSPVPAHPIQPTAALSKPHRKARRPITHTQPPLKPTRTAADTHLNTMGQPSKIGMRSDPSRSQPQPPEKPCPRKPSSPGRPAFQALIEQAGHPRWSQRPPKLIIKRQGLSPWWSPALWLAHRPSAWSAWNCVIVSEEMLKTTAQPLPAGP